MTKAELIAKIAAGAGLTKVQADKALQILAEAAMAEFKDNGHLTLPGLGAFSVVRRPARQGRNPRTLAPLEIPAANSVKFKIAKALKDALN
jgi:DNA-binding protein HU-beta